MTDRDQRIRERAHQIWEQEGHPHGRDRIHWDMARELIAQEDNLKQATKPVAESVKEGASAEPLEAVENQGESPVLNDQGEKQSKPKRRRATTRSATRTKREES